MLGARAELAFMTFPITNVPTAFDIVEFHPFSGVQRVGALCPARDPRACLANLRVCACVMLRSALLLSH